MQVSNITSLQKYFVLACVVDLNFCTTFFSVSFIQEKSFFSTYLHVATTMEAIFFPY